MIRPATKFKAAALAALLLVPSLSLAYFPPGVGKPPVGVQNVPPDPFKPPTAGGLGEPDAPEPTGGPTVQTPEPATVIPALTGLAMAGAYGLRRGVKARA